MFGNFLILSFFIGTFSSVPVHSTEIYRLCVPKIWIKDCQKMSELETDTRVEIQCVPARDKIECLSFIQQRFADFLPVEPEEMYIGMKIPNEDFHIFQEIRTIEEPEAEYRYQAIMLIKNILQIHSLEGLKGLRSCHTGINRNVGYKIPLTMLSRRGIIGPMNDLSLTPKENELKALSQMFNKSCIVGVWSPDPKTNTALKQRYSNLCAMCEDPAKCDYPDNFSGYDGSIRCLARNNGDVAFTKMIYVRMFFGMQVGTIPAKDTGENPNLYSYLCADGSKVPVRERPCSWAARPWPGYMSHQDIVPNIDPLRRKLRDLASIGSKTVNETWFNKVLGLTDYVRHLHDNEPVRPEDFLNDSNYTIVIEREYGDPEQTVRLCVTSQVARKKCETLSLMAYGIDIRPKIECVESNYDEECIDMVKNNKADAASINGNKVMLFENDNVTPLFSEVYLNGKNQHAVAVVKKNSDINGWNDLKNKRSCHNSYESVEGFIAPVNSLIENGFIKENECGRAKYLSRFFTSGSCVPDLPGDLEEDVKSLLTRQCGNDGDVFECLDNRGDVAFVSNTDVQYLNRSRYELVCLNRPDGGRKPLSEWEMCNLMEIPPRSWLGVASRPKRPSDSVTHVLLTISDELTTYRPELFNMFGEFFDNDNVMFSKTATALVPSEEKWFNNFKTVYEKTKC